MNNLFSNIFKVFLTFSLIVWGMFSSQVLASPNLSLKVINEAIENNLEDTELLKNHELNVKIYNKRFSSCQDVTEYFKSTYKFEAKFGCEIAPSLRNNDHFLDFGKITRFIPNKTKQETFVEISLKAFPVMPSTLHFSDYSWPCMSDEDKQSIEDFAFDLFIHELGHYKVCQVLANEQAGKIVQYLFKTTDESKIRQLLYQKLKDDFIKQVDVKNKEYDQITDHGTNQSNIMGDELTKYFTIGADVELNCAKHKKVKLDACLVGKWQLDNQSRFKNVETMLQNGLEGNLTTYDNKTVHAKGTEYSATGIYAFSEIMQINNDGLFTIETHGNLEGQGIHRGKHSTTIMEQGAANAEIIDQGHICGSENNTLLMSISDSSYETKNYAVLVNSKRGLSVVNEVNISPDRDSDNKIKKLDKDIKDLTEKKEKIKQKINNISQQIEERIKVGIPIEKKFTEELKNLGQEGLDISEKLISAQEGLRSALADYELTADIYDADRDKPDSQDNLVGQYLCNKTQLNINANGFSDHYYRIE
ncbi:MAG: DUF922 domain-containing protein [Thiolinea sp.]